MPNSHSERKTTVGLLRRFACIFYDSLLLFSVLMLAEALALLIVVLIGFSVEIYHKSFINQIFVLSTTFLYFGGQWIYGGQTLAMKTWRICLQSTEEDRKPITWKQATIRFFVAFISWAALGLGFFWALFDKQHRTWHDWASQTQLIRL